MTAAARKVGMTRRLKRNLIEVGETLEGQGRPVN